MKRRLSWFVGLAAMGGCGLLGMLTQSVLCFPGGLGARADEPRASTTVQGPVVPDYVPKTDVVRVCRELGIRDWTQLTKDVVTPEEARKILAVVKPAGLAVDPEAFQGGLEVELEHGLKFREANVTNNHPILTGRIVVAHLMEISDYYERLKVLEFEAKLFKAFRSGDAKQARVVYRELTAARISLNREEAAQLGSK
jgi:hypothetical protein